MLYEIVSLLLDTIGALVAGACLLRAWMQALHIGARNPVGGFVIALTDWLVRPLRRILPGVGGVDWASLVAALVISAMAVVVIVFFAEAFGYVLFIPGVETLAVLAVVLLLKWALYVAQLVVIIVAMLSWINPFSPLLPVFDALAAPLLRPIRRVLPAAGRFDLSPLVLFLIIQVALIVLRGLSLRWIGSYF